MGCTCCFGNLRNNSKEVYKAEFFPFGKRISREHLLKCSREEVERAERKETRLKKNDRNSTKTPVSFKEMQSETSCRCPVKETHWLVRDEDFEGNKMINEYVRECKIGSGSCSKVVLHRSKEDERLYAIKIFRKSRLHKRRVSHLETAMTNVLREVNILKQLDHPNIVKLVEVIDDPKSDRFYMVLEYMEGGWIFQGSGPPGGIGEDIACKYFRDIVVGLMYLHKNNVMHGDIKPENLLVSSDGRVKICDFSASRKFEDNNDELQSFLGTPVFTAPECSQGLTYHGKVTDIWALGITLYCMVVGQFPFIGETLRETLEKALHLRLYSSFSMHMTIIVHHPLVLPNNLSDDLADLLSGLLCKDPKRRISLDEVTRHPWVVKGHGPL